MYWGEVNTVFEFNSTTIFSGRPAGTLYSICTDGRLGFNGKVADAADGLAIPEWLDSRILRKLLLIKYVIY